MNRPSVFAKSLRGGCVSIILASVLLSVTGIAQVGPGGGTADDQDAMMRRMVEYFMRVGSERYEQGLYIESERTFRTAQSYRQYLEPVEQRKLDSMLEKAALAAAQRQRVLATRQDAEQLLGDGRVDAARAQLAGIKDSEFLTAQERAAIGQQLRGMEIAAGAVMAPAETPSQEAVPADESNAIDRFKRHIAELYYESTKAYHAGDFETARTGFARVLQSGLMPAETAETIRGYLVEIDGAQAPAAPAAADRLTVEAPRLSSADLAGMPNTPSVADGQSQGEFDRMRQLYNRSYQLYAQGELRAAREGFVEVAESGAFSGPEGRRPEDFIATIDRLLAGTEDVPPTPRQTTITPMQTRPAQAAPQGTTPLNAESASGEQDGFIGVVNQRRNTIRSHVAAVVNDAVEQAQQAMAQGEFDRAREPITEAQRTVSDNQLYLGDDLYEQYSRRLNGVAGSIDQAQAQRQSELAAQRRQEAAEAQTRLRDQAETDRQRRVEELMQRARAYQKQQRYEAALGQVESLLAIDPTHNDALLLKQTLEDMIFLRRQVDQNEESSRERAILLLNTDEATIPYAEDMTYPRNWREIVEKETRKPEPPIGMSEADALAYRQLDTIVDLSALYPEMPMSEAVQTLRNSVQPSLNLVVLWRDLFENADVEPSTPIDMDGLSSVRLGTALQNLLDAVGGIYDLDYVVIDGVVTAGTVESLPTKKMVTRVYDISDLVQPPSTGMGTMVGMGGMGGMMGGMGGMGGMMGGMGGMGGYGMGGMSGMSGMGGMGGYGMSGMSGMGGMGGMGGYGMGMMGGGSMMGGYIAENLRSLIQESIDPESWYELSDTGEGTIMVYPQQQPRKLAIFQTPEVHTRIEEMLNQLRKSLGEQVSLEARFLTVSENFLDDVGLDVDFSYNLGGKFGLVTVQQDSFLTGAPDVATKVPGSLGGITPSSTVTGGYGSILDDLQVSFLVRASQARTDSKSLSAPKVSVMSGETANFSLYDNLSYALPPLITQGITSTISGSQNQQSVINQPQYVTVGSMLYVTPTITKDKKYVLLNIESQQTDLLRFVTHRIETLTTADDTTDGGTAQDEVATYSYSLPDTETATVVTRVSVPDGGTLLLGGHKLTQEVEKETGVPILSKIPILGRAFTNRSKLRDAKVLLILVKPTILLQQERETEALAAMEEIGSGNL